MKKSKEYQSYEQIYVLVKSVNEHCDNCPVPMNWDLIVNKLYDATLVDSYFIIVEKRWLLSYTTIPLYGITMVGCSLTIHCNWEKIFVFLVSCFHAPNILLVRMLERWKQDSILWNILLTYTTLSWAGSCILVFIISKP